MWKWKEVVRPICKDSIVLMFVYILWFAFYFRYCRILFFLSSLSRFACIGQTVAHRQEESWQWLVFGSSLSLVDGFSFSNNLLKTIYCNHFFPNKVLFTSLTAENDALLPQPSYFCPVLPASPGSAFLEAVQHWHLDQMLDWYHRVGEHNTAWCEWGTTPNKRIPEKGASPKENHGAGIHSNAGKQNGQMRSSAAEWTSMSWVVKMQPDGAMRSCTSRFVALLDLCTPGDESRMKQALPSAHLVGKFQTNTA